MAQFQQSLSLKKTCHVEIGGANLEQFILVHRVYVMNNDF